MKRRARLKPEVLQEIRDSIEIGEELGEDAAHFWSGLRALLDWYDAEIAGQQQVPDDAIFWLELREPRRVPERKGPFPMARTAAVLREFFAARPTALITVVTLGPDGPAFQDAPECLQLVDGRSIATGRQHIESSGQEHATVSVPRKALKLVDLVEELCDAVDAAGEDVGGHRGSLTILREIGPALDAFRDALSLRPGEKAAEARA